jgi:hypothetical protein
MAHREFRGLPLQCVSLADVRLPLQRKELYVLAQSHARMHKERAGQRRKLKWLWARLQRISAMKLTHCS